MLVHDDTIHGRPKGGKLTATKIYDGTNVLDGDEVTIGNLVTNETIGYSGARVYNKHVEAVESLRLY